MTVIGDKTAGLAAFVSTVETGSFSAASERLGTTPSAISKSVARLEQRLGAKLFRRSTRSLTLTVEAVTPESLVMRLDGFAKLGREFDVKLHKEKNSRDSDVRLLGAVTVDRSRNAITRFDIVGLGQAWGNKMEYVRREIRLDAVPWLYGIAVELVDTRRPIDLVPPYNMLHYGSGLKYFSE